MGAIFHPETSVNIYHRTLRNIPEERRSHLLCGGSLKSSLVIDTKWEFKEIATQPPCCYFAYCNIISLKGTMIFFKRLSSDIIAGILHEK
jgi:hypothetical protein